MKTRLALCLRSTATMVLLAAGGARAQGTPPATVPSDVSGREGSLSEKLNATNGVIHPAGEVDPAMQKAAPAAGTTPVVPPPGSPGGAPDVTPK